MHDPEHQATALTRPDPASLTLQDAVAQIRNADMCFICEKTRAVMNVAGGARGFHLPFKAEHVSPQTHCSCVEGPVGSVDLYCVVFRRYGTQGRVTVRTPELRDEPLLVPREDLPHPQYGFNFGKRDRGSMNAAYAILRLICKRADAARLQPAFVRDHIGPLGHRGGQISFADLRAWVASQQPAIAQGSAAPLPRDLNDFVDACFDGRIDGLIVSNDSAAAAEQDVIAFCEQRIQRRVGVPDRVRIGIAVLTAWRKRYAPEFAPAEVR
jgi:hypothetical protein